MGAESPPVPDQYRVSCHKNRAVTFGKHMPHITEFAGSGGQIRNQRMVGRERPCGVAFKIADFVDRADPQPSMWSGRQSAHSVSTRHRILLPMLSVETEHDLTAEIEDAALVLGGRPIRVGATGFTRTERFHDRASFLAENEDVQRDVQHQQTS